ncbi:MAG: Crp/Fnr family transcriptional regulator [Candidatus Baltobacteraceae bacterium]
MENLLLAGLPAEERTHLEPFLEPCDLLRGNLIAELRKPVEYVWFPEDSLASRVVDTADGATVEAGMIGREGMVGVSTVLTADASNATVLVQVEGAAMRMRAEHVRTHVIASQSPLFFIMLKYVDAFLALVAQTTACNALHSMDERLARWLLMVNDRIARQDMSLTQESISYMLGVRRATVSLAASALQQRGLIEYTRGHVRILDRTGLENRACPCYAAIGGLQPAHIS